MHYAFFRRLLLFVGLCLLALPALRAAGLPLHVNKAATKVSVAVEATGDDFVGVLENYEAVITVDPAAGRPVGASFEFVFADLKTGKDARDKKMLRWMETDKFPKGAFVLEKLEGGADGKVVAKGSLSLHGVTKPLSFPVSYTLREGRLVLDGEASFDTRDFGLPVIRMLAVLKVEPVVKVILHVEGSHD